MEILRLRTKPVGIALVDKDPDELGINAFRPIKHFRRKLTFCQMSAVARYYGMGMAATLEDMACPGEIIIFGFAEPPSYFLDGSLSYGLYTRTKEAGRALDSSLPRLPMGRYKALLTMSLDNVIYEPKGEIPKWWMPDKVIVIEAELPKTSTGKIDKKILRDRFRDAFTSTV
ncbi:dephospho-CoA kinase [Vulcanisaeta moutnovskia 768-28]|uniref:Dephospho-CoA kinase n=2 Tax=Vulcanisaeta TaxID=164450 RepID=F0QWU6_VULM7|nr:dephospho-CoA kinase [Vulcanisaeta moutnovskia 768-28]